MHATYLTSSNDIVSFNSISFLYLCPKLNTVTFRGNPIASEEDYQERMKRYFPRLKHLDPMPRKYRSVFCINL